MIEAEWMAAFGSAIGERHRRHGEESEDAAGTHESTGQSVIAVADGHSDRRCTRAREGARLAVNSAIEVLSESLTHPLEGVGSSVVVAWRAAVDDALVVRPPEESERQLTSGSPRLLYGTTVLAATVYKSSLRVIQLGDGDVLVGGTNMNNITPVSAWSTSPSGETDSLANEDAGRRFRFAEFNLDSVPIEVLLLATDGFGTAFADPKWHAETMADLLRRLQCITRDELSETLCSWSEHPATVAGDDTTIALLVRSSVLASETSR